MNGFNDIPPAGVSATQFKARVGRRDILPTSVKPRQLPQDFLKNSNTTNGTFSFNDGVTTTLTTKSTSTIDPLIRIGLCPFMIAFFDADSLSAIDPQNNQIPWRTTTGDFEVYGPMAMPQYKVGGKRFYVSSGSEIHFATDGNNTVYKTAVKNSSGGAETVVWIVQSRAIISRGDA